MNFTSIPTAQIQDTMARLSYFEGWDKEQLARLAVGAKQFALLRKEKLAAKGDRLEALYIVVSGQMRLFIPLSNGAERVVSLVERGDGFGEPCLIQDEPCPFEAVAGKDSHLIAIDKLVYRRELRQSQAMTERTLNLISQRLLHTLHDIEICAQPSSLQRVAHYLVHLRPPSLDTEQEFRLPALKRDIAAKLGLSQETFSRMLAFMAQQGFIQLSGSQVRVDDWNRMHGLAKAGCPMEVAGKN
ncbi:MAG: Crp/Fnr family transcriptional regulator [Gallionellaceae bacterium]|nr:Crp/Fnr family transcriptional regulator [Gallionellaceae bacterium]